MTDEPPPSSPFRPWFSRVLSTSLLAAASVADPLSAASPPKAKPAAKQIVFFIKDGKLAEDPSAPVRPAKASPPEPAPRHAAPRAARPAAPETASAAPLPPLPVENGKTTVISTSVSARNKLDVFHKGGHEQSITHTVADLLVRAEACKKAHDVAGYEKFFYRAMRNLMGIMEGSVENVYADRNNVDTIGIGFNMQEKHARAKWNAAFKGVPDAPDFDACRTGKQVLTGAQTERLFVSMMKDSENYLKKLYREETGKRYDDLPANQQAALLSMHYQSPRITLHTGAYAHLAKNDPKGAAWAVKIKGNAYIYASRRDIERALFKLDTETMGPQSAPDHVAKTVAKQPGRKSIVDVYGQGEIAGAKLDDKIRKALKGSKNAYLVHAHQSKGGKDRETTLMQLSTPPNPKGPPRTRG